MIRDEREKEDGTQEEGIFSRVEGLLGADGLQRLKQTRVAVFGVGGVGSWCAECLVRTGIRLLTIVDADRVNITNVNRQLMATTQTVGRAKVEVLKERLLTINPEAEITALERLFTKETAAEFHLEEYDFIIDAIDSLKDKAWLILEACRTEATLFSSMGAALKIDPRRIRVTEFWKVEGDPLARAIRKKFKAMGEFPERKFLCVWSDEVVGKAPLTPEGEFLTDGERKTQRGCLTDGERKTQGGCLTDGERKTRGVEVKDENGEVMYRKAQVNGSLAHITAIFGFTLAGLVVESLESSV